MQKPFEPPENYIDQLAMALPDDLKERQQFLLWKAEPGRKGKKPLKVPYYVNGVRRNGVQGTDTDRANLETFPDVIKAFNPKVHSGIGIAKLPGDGLVGIDGDHCFDGALKPEINSLIQNTYAEISPSGTGVRGLYKGHYGDFKNHDAGVEVFSDKGFLTLTGNQLNYNDIVEMTDDVRKELDSIFGNRKSRRSLAKRLDKAFENDPVFQHLKQKNLILRVDPDGKVHISCPFSAKHTTDDGDKDCTYFLPHTNFYKKGHFHCFHSHCANRTDSEFLRAVGYETDRKDHKCRFKFVSAGTLIAKTAEYLIKSFLESDTLAMIFGDAGTGKSLLAIAISLCIATGTDFYGTKVKQGPVLYIAGEGQGGLARRFLAWAIRNGVEYKDAPFFVSVVPTALCDADQIKHVIQAIEEVAAEVGQPALIVIDTLARNFGPGDENSTSDMTGAIAGADAIRSLYQSTVLLIHHTGHADKSRARGSIALKGALDAEYRLQKDIDDVIRLEATKMKDAAFPEPMAFKIRSVDLPIVDEDLNPVTSAVLDCINYVERPEPGKSCRGKQQLKGIAILRELYDAHRKRVEKSGRDGESARVLLSDWQQACLDSGMQRQAFHKIKQSLKTGGEIRIEHPYVLLNLISTCS